MVMPWAHRNLAQITQMERIAGRDLNKVREIARQYAVSMQHLHENGIVHCDGKQRNVVRIGKHIKLIDLDASSRIGHPCSFKFSEAYVPPEYMQVLLPTRTDGRPHEGHPVIQATVAMDVWVFGVVLFELASGVDLFPKDVNDDSIVSRF